MSIELDIVADVSTRLERAEIPFMLTGSMAMNAYAQPRMTRDLDVVVELRSENSAQLIAAFVGDYYVEAEAVKRALEHKSLFNIIHREWIFKVDCIVRKDSPFHEAEFARRQRLVIGDVATWVVSKEDLILSKLIWGAASRSEYQARDVRNLLNTGCDRGHLLKWAGELRVLDYLSEIER